MATGKITKRTVDALMPASATAFFWDDEVRGFGVRVTASGAKSYVFQYRVGGREAPKKRVTIGRHGSPWTPDSARREAKRLAHLVGQGADPAQIMKDRRREAVTLAFGPYAERFITEYLKSEWPGGWELAAGILRRDAKPFFGDVALSAISRGQLSEFLDTLSSRPAVRRNGFAILRRLFRWAVSRGDLLASPLAQMDAPPAPAARDRVLTDAELGLIWEVAATLDYPFSPLFRLLIVTGQRRDEVAGLPWSELNRDDATWVLPAARSKNKQAHLVPLSSLAIDVLDEISAKLIEPKQGQPIKWPRKGLVLTTTGKTPVSGYSRAKSRLDAQIEKAELAAAVSESREPEVPAPWRIHDIRRTVATGLQRLGVRFEVTEAVLNHVSGAKAGIAGVYQRHDWKEEKRTALSAWGSHITALLSPESDTSNIIDLMRSDQRN